MAPGASIVCLYQARLFIPHEIDHVVAEKHDGTTEPDNLALTCWRCNRHKGSDLGSFDPQTQIFSLLFNPRRQVWTEHFIFQGEQIAGLTPEGRTTVNLLRLNSDERLAERRSL
ncbi:MAG: HNH endonuclease signature motif containing protein [Pyrinomonadaceae bacterium]